MVAENNINYAINTGVKNALVLNDREESGSGTIKFSVKNGVVTVTGTAGSSTSFFSFNFTGISGRFKLNGCPSGGSETTYLQRIYTADGSMSKGVDTGAGTAEFTLDPNVSYQWTIRIQANYAIQNSLVFRPMMYQADTDGSTFQTGALPNYELTTLEAEDREALAEEIDASAKNMLQNTGTTTTISGVTFTVNSDGSVSTYGTSTAANITFEINPSFTFKSGTTYVLSGCPTGGSPDGYRLCTMGTTYMDDYGNGNGSVNVGDNSSRRVAIYIKNSGTNLGTSSSPKIFYPMVCTKAAFGVSSKFVPYRPNWDFVCNSVVDLTDMISSFTVNSSKPVTIKLRRDGSFAMLMFGFVQTIGQVHWYIQSPLTGDALSVIDAITGSTVSQSVITFNYTYSTATLTISASTSGNCNFVLIRSAY